MDHGNDEREKRLNGKNSVIEHHWLKYGNNSNTFGNMGETQTNEIRFIFFRFSVHFSVKKKVELS